MGLFETLGNILRFPFMVVGTVIYLLIDLFGGIKKGVAILGMPAAGKTTLYNYYLPNKGGPQTTIDEYEEFYLDLGDRTILIKKGKDIGGGREFLINKEVLKMITSPETDVILFLFSASEYLNPVDLDYYREVNARLQYIHEKNTEKKNLFVLASFRDYLKDKSVQQIRTEILSKIHDGQRYKTLLTNGTFEILTLRNNKAAVDKYLKQIFNTIDG